MFKRCRRKVDATKMVHHPIIRDSVYDLNGKNEMKTNLSTYVREIFLNIYLLTFYIYRYRSCMINSIAPKMKSNITFDTLGSHFLTTLVASGVSIQFHH